MDILNLLGIEKSIIVLNKCDLVDEEWLEMMEEDVREELSGTFLEHAPLVKVSAATGAGLDDLVKEIEHQTRDEVVQKDIHTIPRLPIDRVFTLSGFGTIITGTLVSGTITKEDTLQMYPVGKECKIRSIQVHGEDKKECYAGQRVAINLSNVKKKEIKRGCVLAPPNSMKNTDLLDVKLNVLDSSVRILTNHTRLHFFTGTSEVLCRAVLLDKEEIGPGESGYVQLRMEEEVAVRRGDKFVVRFYSPMETIGGGVVLEPNPKIKRRFQPEVIEELKRKEEGSSADVIEMHVKSHAETLITVTELAKLTALSPEEVEQDVKELEEQGSIYAFPMRKDTYVWHSDSAREAERILLKALKEYEETYPYRYGIKKAQVQTTYFKKVKPNVYDKILTLFEEQGVLKRVDEFLCTPEYEVRKDKIYDKVSKIMLDTFEKAGFDFTRYSEVTCKDVPQDIMDDILNILLEEKQIVKINDEMYTLTSYMETAKEKIKEHLKEDPLITIETNFGIYGQYQGNQENGSRERKGGILMNLKQLEAFVQVAEGGSFSKAAKQLFLTQPTISAHISSLEKELNARLFVRNTKEVKLSDDGKELYRYARQMIDLQKKIEERFETGKSESKHLITIAASTIPAQYLLPEILMKFNERYPKEQVKLLETDSSQVVTKIIDHMVDVGFTGTVLEKKHCKYIPFYKDELVVITPNTEKYQVLHQNIEDISWISGECLIMREEGSGTRKEAGKQLRNAGINLDKLKIIASIENQETIKKSVKQGMGISIISRLAAEEETKSGDLLTFPIPKADQGRDINLVYNKNYQISKSAERFVKVVKEVYGIEE